MSVLGKWHGEENSAPMRCIASLKMTVMQRARLKKSREKLDLTKRTLELH